MVVVTHEMAFARKVGTRLIFMEHGHITVDGPPTELLDNPPNQRQMRVGPPIWGARGEAASGQLGVMCKLYQRVCGEDFRVRSHSDDGRRGKDLRYHHGNGFCGRYRGEPAHD